MPELLPSTRVGVNGQQAVEVHLKKSLEVTREIAENTPIDTSKPWHVLLYQTDSAQWTAVQSFDSFEAADERFTTLCGNNGIQGKRLQAAAPENAPAGGNPTA